ncbi:MAG TPA: anti-sigma factor antagonist [Verrucomicrobia bacterium]|nr:anti-sigma factor antagonist [Verrucomicrobiota bacterium]
MSLKIEIETRQGGLYIVKLEGKLDTQTYKSCEDRLNALLGKAKVLMFDLAKLDYISSMGLRTILRIRKAMQTAGGNVMMSNVQPQIAKVFEIANALPDVPIFSSTKEADDYFDAMQRKVLEKRQPIL